MAWPRWPGRAAPHDADQDGWGPPPTPRPACRPANVKHDGRVACTLDLALVTSAISAARPRPHPQPIPTAPGRTRTARRVARARWRRSPAPPRRPSSGCGGSTGPSSVPFGGAAATRPPLLQPSGHPTAALARPGGAALIPQGSWSPVPPARRAGPVRRQAPSCR